MISNQTFDWFGFLYSVAPSSVIKQVRNFSTKGNINEITFRTFIANYRESFCVRMDIYFIWTVCAPCVIYKIHVYIIIMSLCLILQYLPVYH